MKINDCIEIKTEGGPCKLGKILAIEPSITNQGTMYLVKLEDYPIGIWFFKEDTNNGRIFINLYKNK